MHISSIRLFIKFTKVVLVNSILFNFDNFFVYGQELREMVSKFHQDITTEFCSKLLPYILSITVELYSVILVGCKMRGRNPDEVIALRKSEYLLLVSYFKRLILKSPDI